MNDKGRSFYEEMQNCAALDLRDRRGKTHNLAFVLLGVILGILRKRDGVLSGIHRSMCHTNASLCRFLGISEQRVVSRSHLPKLLQKVNVEVFDDLLFAHYGLRLDSEEKQWFSGDGKELRGSINTGNKRGQATVQIVQHESHTVIAQGYYDGSKESEKPILRNLLLDKNITSQKITLDALHLCPDTTEIISKAGGVFLIGLKANQATLLTQMTRCSQQLSPIHQKTDFDRKHGRTEQRKYWLYDISDHKFSQRWENTGFATLVKVQRTIVQEKKGKISQETSYYISNEQLQKSDDESAKNELVNAVRNHWGSEVNNHIRDVTLKEDHLRSKKRDYKWFWLNSEL